MPDSEKSEIAKPAQRRSFAARDRLWGVISLLYLLVAIVAALGLLIYTWPFAYLKADTKETWVRWLVTKDQALLILVAIAGGIGSIIYCMRSATWYLGNLEFRRSWAPWYLAQPFIGAALGTMTYVVFRAGLIQPTQQGNDAINLFGFLAISAIVGLYTEQALSQLKLVAETVLRPAPKGADRTRHLRPGEDAKPDAVEKGTTSEKK
jgi:hypothetical protein